VLPRGTMRDIVTSNLPFWENTRLWVIARPLSGFAETFSQYIVEVAPGGGSDRPELDAGAEGVLFVVEGGFTLTVEGDKHDLTVGGYAFLPPGCEWTLRNNTTETARFHWIRKAYEHVDGIDVPQAFVTNQTDVEGIEMPGTEGRWSTQRFADPNDVTPANGVSVDLLDSQNRTFVATTNVAGNFFVRVEEWQPVYPMKVSITANGVTTNMTADVGRNGACASCHFDPVGPASPGHVYTSTDGGVP